MPRRVPERSAFHCRQIGRIVQVNRIRTALVPARQRHLIPGLNPSVSSVGHVT